VAEEFMSLFVIAGLYLFVLIWSYDASAQRLDQGLDQRQTGRTQWWDESPSHDSMIQVIWRFLREKEKTPSFQMTCVYFATILPIFHDFSRFFQIFFKFLLM
jgi:hypothetical protein